MDPSVITRAEIYSLVLHVAWAVYILVGLIAVQILVKVLIFSWVIKMLWKVEDDLAVQKESTDKVTALLSQAAKLLDIIEHHTNATEREIQSLTAAMAVVKEETRSVARVAAGAAKAATEVLRGDINKVPDLTVEKLKSSDGSAPPTQPGPQPAN